MHSYGDQFAVLVKPIEEEKEQLRRKMESERQEIETILERITDFEEVDFPSSCYVNTSTGEYSHQNSRCPTIAGLSSTFKCPFEELDEVHRRLRGLELQSLLTLCFRKPECAEEQDLLSGLAQGSSIYKHS